MIARFQAVEALNGQGYPPFAFEVSQLEAGYFQLSSRLTTSNQSGVRAPGAFHLVLGQGDAPSELPLPEEDVASAVVLGVPQFAPLPATGTVTVDIQVDAQWLPAGKYWLAIFCHAGGYVDVGSTAEHWVEYEARPIGTVLDRS